MEAPAPRDHEDLAAELDRLREDLIDAARLVWRAGQPDGARLIGVLRDAAAALRGAAEEASARSRAGTPGPAGTAEWQDELRARVGTIAGWSRFLSHQRDEATWLRTADVIERNVKFLADLLSAPPD